MVHMRDYSLTGPDGRLAVERGLAAAEWYHTDVPRKDMKALMQRSDMPAIRDTAIWLGLMVVFAAAACWLYPSLWSIPLLLAYGVLYGSASDSRWHECSHGTAFRTQWMNQWVYQIACFMIMRNPVTWRWSHTRHHTDTYIVGRDPEIAVMRPPVLFKLVLNTFGILDSFDAMTKMLRHAVTGSLTKDEQTYVPETEWAKAISVARVWFMIYAATIALAVFLQSWLPVLLVGTPRLYGAWHHIMTGLLQHGGLADNVLDHRMNSRTVYMNPISRFIYWNMNYHIEHHMFPMVPYHALPRLHALIKSDLPEPSSSQWAAYKEIFPAWRRQLQGQDYFLLRALPPTARPYRPELHTDAVNA
ncbi:fatty acid desaturase family protein [Aestuariivirga sp.]|jgi:fatty acid desaturase|uniref:fatty acid desaturase family protein n=1 Tax=Aestuariivirga sp. TaxID=2650926 RepID=UPI003784EE2E